MARNALGRGLSALIREPGLADPPASVGAPTAAAAAAAPAMAPGSEMVFQVDIDLISPSPKQPRTNFDDAALDELAQSISSSGIIQPILLRRNGTRYELIAGERRWRAAQRAGMRSVPAMIREVSDERAVEMTLIENLQREDLNPLEEAVAFDHLMHDFGMTQEQVAERTGKSRSAVSNSLRLLKLEPQVREMISSGKISAGHARALVSITDPATQIEAAKKAARGSVSVRQLERMTSRIPKAPKPGSFNENDPNIRHALDMIQQKFGTKVTLKPFVSGQGGQLIFHFYENEYLSTLYDMLVGEH